MHRSKKIASNFDIKIRAIKAKHNKTGYLRQFIEIVIRVFITPLDNDESFIISPKMFEVKKLFLLLEIACCEQKEITSKRFIKTFHQFTGENYDMAVQFIKVYAVMEKLKLVKPFVMMTNVGQNEILLTINQNISLIKILRECLNDFFEYLYFTL